MRVYYKAEKISVNIELSCAEILLLLLFLEILGINSVDIAIIRTRIINIIFSR